VKFAKSLAQMFVLRIRYQKRPRPKNLGFRHTGDFLVLIAFIRGLGVNKPVSESTSE
jgi:hypothetical protein